MTKIVRYQTGTGADAEVGIGVLTDTGVSRIEAPSMAHLLSRTGAEIEELAANPGEQLTGVTLLPPLDGRGELWCSGVTYERSMSARMEESSESSVYDKVYAAERPELFAKAPAWRLVTDGEPVGIRADSGHDVPEPELALVINSAGTIVGYTICNDMSSRSIEGENPVYIPQAKVFAGSAALASSITLASAVPDAHDLEITISITRDGTEVFADATSTSTLHRRLEDLADWLMRGQDFPDGVILATGTGIVPDLDFALAAGDVVDIAIDRVGTLSNTVVVGTDTFAPLATGGRPTLG